MLQQRFNRRLLKLRMHLLNDTMTFSALEFLPIALAGVPHHNDERGKQPEPVPQAASKCCNCQTAMIRLIRSWFYDGYFDIFYVRAWLTAGGIDPQVRTRMRSAASS